MYDTPIAKNHQPMGSFHSPPLLSAKMTSQMLHLQYNFERALFLLKRHSCFSMPLQWNSTTWYCIYHAHRCVFWKTDMLPKIVVAPIAKSECRNDIQNTPSKWDMWETSFRSCVHTVAAQMLLRPKYFWKRLPLPSDDVPLWAQLRAALFRCAY